MTLFHQTARKSRRRPRIARRFVPRHSLGITLDWDLTSSEKACLSYLLSKPREGAVIYDVSAGEIAAAFGRETRTARRWLEGLEAQTYLVTREGRRRGSLVIMLGPKATRWCQLREPDLIRNEKTRKPSKPPVCAQKARNMSASKAKEEKKEEASRETERKPEDSELARLGELAGKHHGTAAGVEAQMQYLAFASQQEAMRKAESDGKGLGLGRSQTGSE